MSAIKMDFGSGQTINFANPWNGRKKKQAVGARIHSAFEIAEVQLKKSVVQEAFLEPCYSSS